VRVFVELGSFPRAFFCHLNALHAFLLDFLRVRLLHRRDGVLNLIRRLPPHDERKSRRQKLQSNNQGTSRLLIRWLLR